jgi:hypothetical protein
MTNAIPEVRAQHAVRELREPGGRSGRLKKRRRKHRLDVVAAVEAEKNAAVQQQQVDDDRNDWSGDRRRQTAVGRRANHRVRPRRLRIAVVVEAGRGERIDEVRERHRSVSLWDARYRRISEPDR